MKRSAASEEFTAELRRVLHFLYNPAELRKSPLLDMLVKGRDNRLSALRQVLTEAIQALKPSTQVPPHSNAWRVYHTLVWRFLEQWSQEDVAANLAIGSRQLRRIEGLAVGVLADYLWAHHGLEAASHRSPLAFRADGPESGPATAAASHEQELERLGRDLPSEWVRIPEALAECLQTADPLLRQLGLRTDCTLPPALPPTPAQSLPLRQALLNVLSAAARSAPGGTLRIGVEVAAHGLCVQVCAMAEGSALLSQNAEAAESLAMARRLLELSGGTLDAVSVGADQHAFEVTLVLPAGELLPVLVVDDNADTLQLFKRYLSGSRYTFMGTTNPEAVLSLAQELVPRIILLDVMVPGIDGWQILSRVREHPRLGSVPVLVCTILPLEQLALTLGASGFIRKPVSREALLSALDRCVHEPARGSH